MVENTQWTKLIYLPYWIQWVIMLIIIIVLVFFLTVYRVAPVYQLTQQRLQELEKNTVSTETNINEYRREGPTFLLIEKISQSRIEAVATFSEFILNYRKGISAWQDEENQQGVTLLLSWQEFILLWDALVQLKHPIKPAQLQLSAQNGLILIKISYEKR
ncbi:hypothetical protein EFZ10_00325 [Tatumella sp. TA1]|uniref:hypothetical protein n=1 Tax=Rosenbergiella collisarenosi TaxID=1544695 RepID=UPI0008F8479F|nr:hypothetical protein [Rosenbergiella collisarenosi]QGX90211.1 hypothetical protein EFZ10_00325 [Tatumella sp. TA1]